MAASLAVAKVGPRPTPLAWVMGHHAFTLISPATACTQSTKEAMSVKHKRRCMLCLAVSSMEIEKSDQPLHVARVWSMRLIVRIGVCLFAAVIPLVLLWSESKAANVGVTRVQSDGVTINVRTLRDRVIFCINADQDHKISSEFGVEFTVFQQDERLWAETFPKIVTRSGWYFNLPLGLNLKTRAEVSGRTVRIKLGACSVDELCNVLNFSVEIPSQEIQADRETSCEALSRNSP
jgi:hypothetical protein